MSSLFEKAIADAKELKETALKNAEQLIIEKYSTELKEAVENLLEEEDEEESVEMDMEVSEEEPEAPTGDDKLLDQVPDAATIALAQALEDDEEEIVIDFDELMSDMEATTPEEEAEEIPADAESPIDREELLDAEPVALEEEALEEDLEEALENLTEEDLNSLLEEVDVDIKSMHPNNGWAGSTAGDRAENADLAAIAAALDEEQEKTKELEEQNAMLNETVQKNNDTLAKAKQIIQEMKNKMNDVNLLNARLFYTNKILESKELNTRQKDRIVESLANAKTIEETKLVYQTLKESVGSTQDTAPKSLVETVNRTRSLVLSAQKREEKKEAAPMYENWKKLAGINK
tara:strand:- start:1581 stop:2621 length:1041 start_codon:yes stop_codon:yes gene_type:complete